MGSVKILMSAVTIADIVPEMPTVLIRLEVSDVNARQDTSLLELADNAKTLMNVPCRIHVIIIAKIH